MKKLKLLIALMSVLLLSSKSNAQSDDLKRITRLNYVNPAIQMEFPTSTNTMFVTSAGFGFNPIYYNNQNRSGMLASVNTYMFNFFINADQLFYINRKKRETKGKNTANNSGNFFKINTHINGPAAYTTMDRYSDWNFSFSVLYGWKRAFGKNSKFHYEFAFGLAAFNINTLGQTNWDPFALQFNIGHKL